MTPATNRKPQKNARRSQAFRAMLSAMAIAGSAVHASATPKPSPLTPDRAILACHAHSIANLTAMSDQVTATRRYHAVKTADGLFKVIGHFSERSGLRTAQFDVECLIATDGNVVDYSVASKPVSSEQVDLSVALSRLANDPGAKVPAALSRVNFQEAFYIVDRLDRSDLETLSKLIDVGAISLPVNIREAIDARLPANSARRFGGR